MSRFLLLLVMGVLTICSSGAVADSTAPPEPLAMKLSQSPYVRELISFAGEMTTRAIERQITYNELSRAYQELDDLAIAELLGYSDAELHDLSVRLEYLRECIYAEFPEIEALAEAQAQEGRCDEAFLAQLFATDHSQNFLSAPPPGASCAWLPYTAALTLCTALGPVLYWACATVALCTYCSGGLIDTICGRTPAQE